MPLFEMTRLTIKAQTFRSAFCLCARGRLMVAPKQKQSPLDGVSGGQGGTTEVVLLNLDSRAELDDALGCDLDLRTGARIATYACRALHNRENAHSRQRNFIILLQRADDNLDECIHRLARLDLCKTCFERNRLHQL